MRTAAIVALALIAGGCGDDLDPAGAVGLTRTWRGPDLPGCPIASPLLAVSRGEAILLAALADGTVIASDPDDGSEVFRVALPAGAGQVAHVAATPGLTGSRAVIPVMLRDADTGERLAHEVVVLDLEARALDPGFPAVR